MQAMRQGIKVNGVLFVPRCVTLMADTVAKNSMIGLRGVGARSNCHICRAVVSLIGFLMIENRKLKLGT